MYLFEKLLSSRVCQEENSEHATLKKKNADGVKWGLRKVIKVGSSNLCLEMSKDSLHHHKRVYAGK